MIMSKIIIKNNYKNLINDKYYEKVLCEIMNKSKLVFPNKYINIEKNKQSNGESDFIDLVTKEKIDAKTIFPSDQCENLSLNNIEAFLEQIKMETNEIYDDIMNNNIGNIENSIIYNGIKKSFDKIDDGENLLIFIPFPFTTEIKKSLSSILGSNIFLIIMKLLAKEKADFFKKHTIYFIYPNYENKIVLRNYSEGILEYIDVNILSQYIKTLIF